MDGIGAIPPAIRVTEVRAATRRIVRAILQDLARDSGVTWLRRVLAGNRCYYDAISLNDGSPDAGHRRNSA
jgi:hypothetical protein